MAEDTIIVIDKIEEAEDKNGKTYLKITDKAGVTRNFKEGRAKLLTNKGHLLEEGKAIKLHFEDYTTPEGKVFPFVKNFESVKDEFVAQAAEKVQTQVKVDRNDSIERAVAVKEIGLDWREGKRKDDDILVIAREAWLIDAMNYREAKGETTKDNTDNQETQTELTNRQDSGEAIKTAGELFNWIMKRDPNIKAPRLWVNTEFGVDDKLVLTDKKVAELYKTIKERMSW